MRQKRPSSRDRTIMGRLGQLERSGRMERGTLAGREYIVGLLSEITESWPSYASKESGGNVAQGS